MPFFFGYTLRHGRYRAQRHIIFRFFDSPPGYFPGAGRGHRREREKRGFVAVSRQAPRSEAHPGGIRAAIRKSPLFHRVGRIVQHGRDHPGGSAPQDRAGKACHHDVHPGGGDREHDLSAPDDYGFLAGPFFFFGFGFGLETGLSWASFSSSFPNRASSTWSSIISNFG